MTIGNEARGVKVTSVGERNGVGPDVFALLVVKPNTRMAKMAAMALVNRIPSRTCCLLIIFPPQSSTYGAKVRQATMMDWGGKLTYKNNVSPKQLGVNNAYR